MTKKRITSGTGRTSERRVILEMEVTLSPDELLAESKLLAQETMTMEVYEDEKKKFDAEMNKKIKELEASARPRAKVVNGGKQKQKVECVELANFDRNTILIKNAKTGEHLSERPMESEERDAMAQGRLPWPDADDLELPEKAENDIESDSPKKSKGNGAEAPAEA